MQDDLTQCDIEEFCEQAARVRDAGKGRTVSYSLNVFLPLTRLCRNACRYCDYRVSQPDGGPVFVSPEEVLTIARAGERAGCTEALLVSGDKPELRFPKRGAGFVTTTSTARLTMPVKWPASLSPKRDSIRTPMSGVANRAELVELKKVNASIGLMLESTAERLSRAGGPHDLSPDKLPRVRLDFLANAGELRIPTTTGLLIGIGETRRERLAAIHAIRKLHEEYGHIQEVIVQNFRPKNGSDMHAAAAVPLSEILWTSAAARLLLGPRMNIQVAPNLVPRDWLAACLGAGVNDWGGVSPLTPDYVNRECPWPELSSLQRQTESAGFVLRPRFPVYPEFVKFLPPLLGDRLNQEADEGGYVRTASSGQRLT